MKNNTNKLIVFIFVGILILLASLWVKNCNAETFDVNDTIAGGPSGLNPDISLSDTAPDSLFNDPNLYTDPSLNKNKDIDHRECAVYYVNHSNPQIDITLRSLCDQGFFDKPEVTMKVRENVLQQKSQNNTITDDERKELQYIGWYNWYKPRLPNGTCKVTFNDWVEPNKTADNQLYPVKNAVNFQDKSRGNPKDWAFCYKKVESIGGDSIDTTALNNANNGCRPNNSNNVNNVVAIIMPTVVIIRVAITLEIR